uniref:Prohead protease n=1 Tax=viral metagenome TaxID=1070528 RepID=A0A6M3LFI5_9ZZZZ
MKDTTFNISLNFIEDNELAQAGIPEEYKNPLLTWVRFIFTDDQPNANKQGISQDEFPNLMKSMAFMPIKANFDSEFGLEGHSDARIIGVIKAGQQQGNSIVAVGALYADEHPDVVEFFKKEMAEGNSVDFSWEIRYKDSEDKDGVEWLKNITTKAVTAVQHPAYEGRTPLVSISAKDLIELIDGELKDRKVTEVVK